MDEKEKEEVEELSAEDLGVGDTPKEAEKVVEKDATGERLDRIDRTLDRMERAGVAEAGQTTPKKKPLSNEEYAKAFVEGEVENPFKE